MEKKKKISKKRIVRYLRKIFFFSISLLVSIWLWYKVANSNYHGMGLNPMGIVPFFSSLITLSLFLSIIFNDDDESATNGSNWKYQEEIRLEQERIFNELLDNDKDPCDYCHNGIHYGTQGCAFCENHSKWEHI